MTIIIDGYCRVSTDPQEDRTSLDEQERCIREYCAANGLILGMIHRETFTGYQYRERKKLTLMRERYREGKIQGVVVRTLDRLSRKQSHYAVLMDEMNYHNVAYHCVKEPVFSEDKAMDEFIRIVLAFVAEVEREKIMDRTTSGRVSKARDGHIVSGSKAPYGWRWEYDDEDNKSVLLHEEQAAVLRWLAEQYAAGVSPYSLVQQLLDLGIPSPTGTKWNDNTIRRLLFDPRITGKNAKVFAYQKRQTKQPLAPIDLPDGTYPAIISEDLYEQILARRDSNPNDAMRACKEPEAYLLRAGFIRCARCGKLMLAGKHRGKYIYRCKHGAGHTNVILVRPLDAEIWQWLQQLADHTDLIEQAVTLATATGTLEHDAKMLEQSIETWRAKANNYLADLDDHTLVGESRAAIRHSLNNANKMVAQLEAEKAQLEAGLIDKERERAAYQEILAWCRRVKEAREEMIYQRKRDFLRMLGVVVLVDNVKPYYDHLIYRIEIILPTIQALIAPIAVSNCPSSSDEDIVSTKQLVEAGRILDIELVDHIIIGQQRFVSLKEHLRWE